MEQFERVRREHEQEGLSIRALATRHGVHRRAVRQALASAVPPARKTPERQRPVLGGVGSLALLTRRHRARQRAAGAWTSSHAWLVRGSDAALALMLGQVALGVANLASATSALTVIPHLAVASWIWVVLVAVAAHAGWLAPPRTGQSAAARVACHTEGLSA